MFHQNNTRGSQSKSIVLRRYCQEDYEQLPNKLGDQSSFLQTETRNSRESHATPRKARLKFQEFAIKAGNTYFLTVIDDYSRNLFAFLWSELSPETVCSLFSMFRLSAYIYTDYFNLLKQFLSKRGVSVSRSVSYNPEGNDLCEGYNRMILKTI